MCVGYLGAAVDRCASVHDDASLGEVPVQLHCVELPQLDRGGVANSGHA